MAPLDLLNQLNSSIIRMKWYNLLLKTHSARNWGVWGPKFEEIWVPSALRLHLKLLFVGSKCVCVGVVGRLCDARDQQYLLSYKSDTIWNLLKWWWFLVKMLTNIFLVPWSSGSLTDWFCNIEHSVLWPVAVLRVHWQPLRICACTGIISISKKIEEKNTGW